MLNSSPYLHLPWAKWPPIRRTFSTAFSCSITIRIQIQISRNLFPKNPVDKKPALVHAMAWRRTDDKLLPEPMTTYFTLGEGELGWSNRCEFWVSASIWTPSLYNDVNKRKHIPRYWPIVLGITGHRWIPITKASAAEFLCFPWSAPRINGRVNNREAGDLRRHRAHYNIIVMLSLHGNRMSVSHRHFETSKLREILTRHVYWIEIPASDIIVEQMSYRASSYNVIADETAISELRTRACISMSFERWFIFYLACK